MNAVQKAVDAQWLTICPSGELKNNLGARALVNGKQVALFKVQNALYAVSAVDPFSKAAVLSRGLVGDLKGQVVVASPIYKQHFNLATGACLEDQQVSIETYAVRDVDGWIQLQA
jgi:nitrite reductase (NADH) small subunit